MPAPHPIQNPKAVALRVTTKQWEWYGFSLPFLWRVSLLISSSFTACFPQCGGSLVTKLLMPGYFLIGVYSARRHFYEYCILTQWGHWGLNFWLQFIFNCTLCVHLTELYPPSRLFLWQSSAWFILNNHLRCNAEPCKSQIFKTLSELWIHCVDKQICTVSLFHASSFLYGFHVKGSMYSSAATKISVAWRHISVQSLQGAKRSGSNMFSFQDWLP